MSLNSSGPTPAATVDEAREVDQLGSSIASENTKSATATPPGAETAFNEASTVKRRRATKAEMEERAEFLVSYAEEHGPITVRGLYYQAEVHGVPGIDKGDNYRKALWNDTDAYVEIWCEKDALAGVIYPITSLYDTPLMITRGFSSETFAYEAIAARRDDDRPYHVYYLGDFDRAGQDAARSLQEKLERFADEECVEVNFETLALEEHQIRCEKLPTRESKRVSPADKKWPHDFACELDAVPPDVLRSWVEMAINIHLPQDQLKILKVAEESEREIMSKLVGRLA
jgi:hypothetical protein